MKAWLGLLLCLGASAQAQVVSSSATGFALRQEAQISASPQLAYEQFLAIGQWWDSDHSWFGDAGKMTLEPRVGGCFCETNGKRQALHMQVTYVDPGKELRMVGGLGPLQMMGLTGGMAWRFEPVAGGKTLISLHYQVAGYAAGGLEKLAAIVDQVQGAQLARLKAQIDGKSRSPGKAAK
ncbi:SRPBCC family protein [Gallaecimonas xiamenensis]|uniref:Activator of Hsp90 ATPase 1 family protein n=1 Tax=Gallaecimonas xiamenensis 3-C-1 TaxID=745411 RepID=K2JSD8_9GAMM|nr:SRPBCC domain-containing protein [Gallaecimonas xiamenensis]EKE77422.1 activator of Hsp90 ATPase 1 family protein [Gallaecimonas xiamenensis 3-C-1]